MHDIKFALGKSLKNPSFTAVAVLTLALGIGAEGILDLRFAICDLRMNLERAVGPTMKHTKHTKSKRDTNEVVHTHPVNASPGSIPASFVYLVCFVG